MVNKTEEKPQQEAPVAVRDLRTAMQTVIENLNNATAIMRDKPFGGAPDRHWLTNQVNILRGALEGAKPQQEAVAVELTKCCGREECGGECGNEWRGTELVRIAVPVDQQEAEPVAYCQSDDPWNSTAFSWPGSARNALHTTPLYAAPQPRIDLSQFKELAITWADVYDRKPPAPSAYNEGRAVALYECANDLLALIAEQEGK